MGPAHPLPWRGRGGYCNKKPCITGRENQSIRLFTFFFIFYGLNFILDIKSYCMIVLLCGLSGVGKTTLASIVENKLNDVGIWAQTVDGDEYRKTLCKDLGFSRADRCENIRRLGAVADKLSSQGIISVISAINPYEQIRNELKSMYENVKIIHLDCAIYTLIERDTKGLYKRAVLPDGHPEKISNLTGVNDQFEVPKYPDLYINTGINTIEQCSDKLFLFLIHEINNYQRLDIRYGSKKSA